MTPHTLRINAARLVVLAFILVGWQYVPKLVAGANITLLKPTFISTPASIFRDLYQIIFVSHVIFPALWSTLSASLAGLVLGFLTGYILGLVFSEFRTLDSVFMIFINAVNAVPRITIYPLIIIVFGFGFSSKVIGAYLISFFIVFYNSYQGSKNVPTELVDSYAFLGAGRWQIVRYVRAYVAFGWAFALLPTLFAFTLIAVITTELLISSSGLGALLIVATSYLDTARVFSIIFVSMVTSVVLVETAKVAVNKLAPWVVAIR
jgi:NitT/TauT family transport system permease protein